MDRTARSTDAGIALLAVLLGLALLGTVAAAVVAVGIVEYRASRDYLAATKATLVAEAGVSHAMAVVGGPLKSRSFNEILTGADGTGTGDGALCGRTATQDELAAPTYDTGTQCAVPGADGPVIVDCADLQAKCLEMDPASIDYAMYCSGLADGSWSYDWSCVGDDAGDDGVLAGFSELEAGDELPADGVAYGAGDYQVRLVNDAEDPSADPFVDTNDRIVAISRGETADGSVAEVKVMLEAPPFPAVVVNGFLRMSANAAIEGPCAGAHANGDLEASSGVIVQGPITAADSVIHWWSEAEEADHATEIESHEPKIGVPRMDPLDYCGDADYILRNGWKINMTATPDSAFLGGGNDWSWSKSSNTYKLGGQPSNLGTFCAQGNISYTASIGSETEPAPITLIATGAVSLGGKSRIAPAHPDGLLIVAGGDIAIGGQAGARYSGLVYTENQCVFSGNATVEALVLCYDAPDSWSMEAEDITDWNEIGGSTTITYDCSGPRQPPRVTAWWE